ncbi:metalloregulator ArsR/SmtB family transcription factor [Glycomyces sp. YM15]|uniref:ArsR/SmtB family transcription factor n=1 Tax=Glycomyces sp. YM15 TaxID=2800446 RepID=UPI001962D8E2|nr:metalloregulator ArsR/SmtB family transcription factor [Glycomyces sp. YM15]
MSETPASGPDAVLSGPDVPTPPAPPAPPEPPALSRFRGKDHEKITDPERMKALAHPARMAVFDFLAARSAQGLGGATATEIAEVAGMTPSAMSYHLRTLAKAGFIEEAPSRGDARERVWRLILGSFSISAEKDAPESHKVIERTMGDAFREQQDRNFSRWLDRRSEVDQGLREVALMQQGHLRLTLEEAAEFVRRFQELEQEYAELTDQRKREGSDPEDGTVLFNSLFRFYPRV